MLDTKMPRDWYTLLIRACDRITSETNVICVRENTHGVPPELHGFRRDCNPA